MQRLSPSSWVFALLAAASAGALGVAFVAQYGFDLWPCLLCYWQRPAYVAVLVFALLSLMPAVDGRSRRLVLFHCAALFLLNIGFAGYHVGVEQHWWKGPAECIGTVSAVSMADILAAVNQPGRTGCEEAAIRIFGISMAGYNLIACLTLALGSLWAARKKQWWIDAP